MNIIISILIFAIIIVIHEFGHFLLAKLNGVGVIEFAVGMGPKLLSKKIGETVYSLRLIPFGGFCSMVGEDTPDDKGIDKEKSFAEKSLLRRFSIVIAGPLFNFLLAFVCAIIYVTMFGTPNPAKVVQVYENTPAMESGIEVGDVIKSINGRKMASHNDITEYNVTHGGEEYSIVVDRNGEELTYTIMPVFSEDTGYYIMGVSIDATYTTEGRSLGTIFSSSYYEIRNTIRTVFDSFRMLGKGTASVKDMTGVVGIVDMMGDSVEEANETSGTTGVISFVLYMLIFLSINIGIMNLIPFPALDGGRCFIYIIEAITKKTLPRKVEAVINTSGLLFLMGVMVIVLFNDIFRIVTG